MKRNNHNHITLPTLFTVVTVPLILAGCKKEAVTEPQAATETPPATMAPATPGATGPMGKQAVPQAPSSTEHPAGEHPRK